MRSHEAERSVSQGLQAAQVVVAPLVEAAMVMRMVVGMAMPTVAATEMTMVVAMATTMGVGTAKRKAGEMARLGLEAGVTEKEAATVQVAKEMPMEAGMVKLAVARAE